MKKFILTFFVFFVGLLTFQANAQTPDRFTELEAIKSRTLLRMRDLEQVTRSMAGPEGAIASDINNKHELASALISNGQDLVYLMMLADGREKSTQLVYGQLRINQLIQLLDIEIGELTTLTVNTSNPLNMRASAGLRGALTDVVTILKSME